MPSARELRSAGRNDLACQVAVRGGFRTWAARLGLPLKESETRLGQSIEDAVEAGFRAHGRTVSRMTCKAPFDLLVDGVRVDVKAAKSNVYTNKETGHVSQGYFFGINKREPTCDLYLLCCLREDESIGDQYYVPSEFARVSTLTITPTGAKYRQFLNDSRWLDRLMPDR